MISSGIESANFVILRLNLKVLTAVVMKISNFLGYNPMQYVQSKQMFRRNISSSYSGSKNNLSKKPDTPVDFNGLRGFISQKKELLTVKKQSGKL
jgi:hypothetical protein